jgi:hypothetical protein
MRNDECIIYIHHKGRLVNTWYKEGDGWVLISTRGIHHKATAEQFISHLLPSLMKDDFTVTVKRKDQEGDASSLGEA